MKIDNCKSNFSALATKILPGYMKSMRAAMKKSHQMADFCDSGKGVKAILDSLEHKKDFSGCYVFLKEKTPFYVGISRRLVGRLHQHGVAETRFGASLAYLMASQKMPHKMKRDEAMADPKFRKVFDRARSRIRKSSVAFIEIENQLELYLFEPYCAMKLGTGEWNTFKTH